MFQLKFLLMIGSAIALSAGVVNAQTTYQANVIENIVAIQMAQTQCGYKVNYGLLAITMNAVNLRTEDLLPGGKYSRGVERNQARVLQLVATDSGKTSFCRNVRRDLSAMFD